jgi:VanZ family protein
MLSTHLLRRWLLSKSFNVIKIAPDKKKHFWVGMLMGAIFQILSLYLLPQHYTISVIITFILVVSMSYGFELFSLITKRGHYEILDAVAGIIGGAIGMLFILLINYVHNHFLFLF